MRIDFHCHLFPAINIRKLLEAGIAIYKGYGFYERMIRKLEKIQSIEALNIMEKTICHINNANIDKVILLPVNSRNDRNCC